MSQNLPIIFPLHYNFIRNSMKRLSFFHGEASNTVNGLSSVNNINESFKDRARVTHFQSNERIYTSKRPHQIETNLSWNPKTVIVLTHRIHRSLYGCPETRKLSVNRRTSWEEGGGEWGGEGPGGSDVIEEEARGSERKAETTKREKVRKRPRLYVDRAARHGGQDTTPPPPPADPTMHPSVNYKVQGNKSGVNGQLFSIKLNYTLYDYIAEKNVPFDRVFNDIEEDENQIRKSLSTGCTEIHVDKGKKRKWKENEEIKIIRGPRSILKAENTNTANPSPGSRPKIRGSLALFAEDGHLLMRAQGQVLVYKNEKTLLHPKSFHLPPLLPPSSPPPPPSPPPPLHHHYHHHYHYHYHKHEHHHRRCLPPLPLLAPFKAVRSPHVNFTMIELDQVTQQFVLIEAHFWGFVGFLIKGGGDSHAKNFRYHARYFAEKPPPLSPSPVPTTRLSATTQNPSGRTLRCLITHIKLLTKSWRVSQ
ncbi:hypothetical protein V1478_000600 [Vespula squamosa]|uniref:Uncharacterized protein n=1 Tax=Vespula squamosa TaxID=30214 RepID=A0ABD2C6T8_VESSQ